MKACTSPSPAATLGDLASGDPIAVLVDLGVNTVDLFVDTLERPHLAGEECL